MTQMAIKRQLMFPPHPMCASALPGENGRHEIGVDMSKERQKISATLSITTWRRM